MERVTIEGKEYGKIPFDLERWQSGYFVAVLTRFGSEVSQLTLFETPHMQTLIGIVEDELKMYKEEGNSVDEDGELDLHLIIELPQPKEYWQNVYADRYTYEVNYFSDSYKSKAEADDNRKGNEIWIGYMKVKISEDEQPKYEFIPL